MKYLIRSGKLIFFTNATDRAEAWRHFFRYVRKNWEQCKYSIGHLAELVDENERYPMRTIPALYGGGLLDLNEALKALTDILSGEENELLALLALWTLQDAWVWR